MQIKKLLAVSGIAVVATLGPTSMFRASATVAVEEVVVAEVSEAVVEEGTAEAGTAEEEGHSTEGKAEISHAAHECIDLLEKGGAIDECQKAPNPILPPMSELVWGSAAFFVVLAGLWKFAMPALRKTMAARSAKIEGDLNAAAKAKTDAEAEAATYRAQIGNANVERDKIVEEARAQADQVRKDLIARAEADAAEIRQKASDDSASQSSRLKGELESHVKRLSVDLAEKVVGANLNRDTNNALVDRYIAELGAK